MGLSWERREAENPLRQSGKSQTPFIWGMGGENLDYGDQDFSLISDLK